MPLETALSVGISALATEHFFTAFLSSPKASEQFLKPEDVKQMFTFACLVSLGLTAILAITLKNVWGFVACLILIVVFYLAYKKAMGF